MLKMRSATRPSRLPLLRLYSTPTAAAPPKLPRAPPPALNTFRYFVQYNTRWSDNDMYGHLNNPQYIHYVDSAVNEYMISHCSLTPSAPTSPIALAVSSSFSYASPLSYPDPILAGISIEKLGKSSVTWRVGLFDVPSTKGVGAFEEVGGMKGVKGDQERKAACYGHFVHVFVDPKTRKPVEIPSKAKEMLQKLVVEM